jgi:hypothetical protein
MRKFIVSEKQKIEFAKLEKFYLKEKTINFALKFDSTLSRLITENKLDKILNDSQAL